MRAFVPPAPAPPACQSSTSASRQAEDDAPMLRVAVAILGAGLAAAVTGSHAVVGYLLAGCLLYAVERLVSEVRRLRRQISA